MVQKLQRYDIGHLRDFRGPIVVKAAAAENAEPEAPPPPPPPAFKQVDLDHAREAGKKLGYAEGFEAGIAQATTEATNRAKDLATAMTRIADQTARLSATYRKLVAEQATELSELVTIISRKVAGEALDKHGTETVAALVERCLPIVFGKPKITIDLSLDAIKQVEPVLRERLEQGGFTGDIVFRANEALEGYDIRIDWVHGQASRSTTSLWQEIEALLASMPLTPTVPTVKEVKPTPIAVESNEENNHG